MLSKRISYLRKKKSLSQAQLASQIGLSPSALGMYEQGRREPTLDVLVAMARIFDVSLDFLITGTEYSGNVMQSENIRFLECPCKTCFWKEYKEQ